MSSLTRNAVRLIYTAHEPKPDRPILQIIDLKKISSTGAANTQDRYRLILSDGEFYLQGILGTQLNEMVRNEVLKQFCIVRMVDYLLNEVHGRKVAIILNVEVVSSPADKIGEPQNVETATLAPVSSMPPAPLARGGSSYAGSGSYGGGSGYSVGASAHGSGPRGAVVVPIKSLHPYANKWTIQVRVTNKSDMRTWRNQKGEGKLFSIDLLDADGDDIRATAFNAEAELYHARLQVGSVYYISRAQVKVADKRYNNGSCQYEITLDKNTVVEDVHESVPEIKLMNYNFVAISDIEQKAKDSMVDVIGVVQKVGDLGSVTAKTTGNMIPKRVLTLVDTSNKAVEVTLWGSTAENWNTPGNPVLAIKTAKVSDYNGKSLGTISSSNVAINPDLPEAHALKGWFESGGMSGAQSISSGGGGGGARGTPRKMIADISAENLGSGDKPDWFTVRGTLTYIKRDGTLYYAACPNPNSDGKGTCNKKVIENNGNWTCERCAKTFARPQFRYIFGMSVCDYTGSTFLSVFDETGQQILGGVPADELRELKERADPRFDQIMDNAMFATYNFKVRAKMEMYQNEQKLKSNVVNLTPLNFAEESRTLIADIKRWG